MKNAVIYYFSGTGNTRTAAEMVGEALEKRGVKATLFDVRRPLIDIPDPDMFDAAGFAYPIHAFNTPRFFLRFADMLPKAPGRTAFIFKTSGEPFRLNDASSRALMRKLRRKGFRVVSDVHMLMPYNIMFRYPDAIARQMYLHTRDMAELTAKKLLDGSSRVERCSPLIYAVSLIFRIQWFGAFLNGPLIHAKKDLCTGCGLCAKRCPAQNITMVNGLPRFSHHCTMCMSCSYYCPKDAVRPGFLTGWRVNGPYDFKKDSGERSMTGERYFRHFAKYYAKTYAEIEDARDKEGVFVLDDTAVKTYNSKE